MTAATDLEAGPSLDALVAERVMGWKRGGENDWVSPKSAVCAPWDQKGAHPYLKSPDRDVYYLCECRQARGLEALPPYSTDIAAAMVVVERVGRDWSFLRRHRGEEWAVVDDIDWMMQGANVIGEGQTLQLAICRAALAAVGHR